MYSNVILNFIIIWRYILSMSGITTQSEAQGIAHYLYGL